MAKSYRGLFRPTNPKKYIGNTKQIVYRSLLERRFMRYCDLNQDILYWASEELPVRYYNPLDKKYHRYFPDFVVKTSKQKKYMIEVKPSPISVPDATDDITEKIPPALGTLLVESLRTRNGVEAEVDDIVKFSLLK